MIPSDPVMLLSFLNMKLRDFYPSLSALCEDLALDEAELIEKMRTINYEYDASKNCFV
ncbi:MAG: DUF4250 domain-containing protein [Lachnospiraceae bacterium]|nr:DUF4250 domain-containing protein [Lachnospiraceae bacterium]